MLRSAIFDYWVSEFLREHPGGSVAGIGAGLNTRYERLDSQTAHWLEIDLPDAMELRRRFFSDTEQRTMHAGSASDTDWISAARNMPGPWCFVSEAALIYLPEPEVRAVVGRIRGGFPGATLPPALKPNPPRPAGLTAVSARAEAIGALPVGRHPVMPWPASAGRSPALLPYAVAGLLALWRAGDPHVRIAAAPAPAPAA